MVPKTSSAILPLPLPAAPLCPIPLSWSAPPLPTTVAAAAAGIACALSWQLTASQGPADAAGTATRAAEHVDPHISELHGLLLGERLGAHFLVGALDTERQVIGGGGHAVGIHHLWGKGRGSGEG